MEKDRKDKKIQPHLLQLNLTFTWQLFSNHNDIGTLINYVIVQYGELKG